MEGEDQSRGFSCIPLGLLLQSATLSCHLQTINILSKNQRISDFKDGRFFWRGTLYSPKPP